MNGLQSAIAETLHSFSGTPESRSGTGDERVSGIKSGRVALVTGASRWLGVALAQGLASDGWVVAVNYRSDHAGAARTVEAISAAGGRGAPVRFDVTDEVEVARGMAEISDVLGPLDLIVNNATGPQPLMPVMEQTWRTYLDQLEFFVNASLLLLKSTLPDWRQKKSGRVINIGSEVVNIGNPEFAHYVAAEAAMLGLTRSWARELGPDGITVNLVEPGWIPVERHAGETASSIDAYRREVPMGRMGLPSDLVGMVVFLTSPRASFVTGQSFAVNGGRTLCQSDSLIM